MARDIVIIMKDATERKFPHRERSGGSYTKSIRYEPGFVVVVDEFYHEIAIPSSDIKEVKVFNN